MSDRGHTAQALLIENIGLLATPAGNMPARGEAMRAVTCIPQAAVLIRDGIIEAVYTQGTLPGNLPKDLCRVDAHGMLATPGLIDAHTHLVFGGWRQQEAAQRAQGVDYMEILREGGGILDTVRHTRAASYEALLAKGAGFVREMLSRGVTACEIKSGYGLDIETEAKQLCVARALGEGTPMEVVTTYLGAHAVPPEYKGRTDAYVDFLVEEAIPAIAAEDLADFCDVFCEADVFDLDQSRRILQAAMAHGLRARMHADEIVSLGGGGLAAELNAASADHLIAVSEESLLQLAQRDTVAVLLPQTSLFLGKPFAPARRMIELGVPVALATDFNPGSCPSNNLPLSMTLGMIRYGMTPEELLTAVTLNAAAAIGKAGSLGTLEPGKQADLVLWDAEDIAMLCYRMGSNLARAVYKRGELVAQNNA